MISHGFDITWRVNGPYHAVGSSAISRIVVASAGPVDVLRVYQLDPVVEVCDAGVGAGPESAHGVSGGGDEGHALHNPLVVLGASANAEPPQKGAGVAWQNSCLRARLDCLTKPSDISHLTKFSNLNFGFL